MIKYYKKKCISAKNSDLSWALHSLDCLEANIFKTTFFCQVFAYFTPLLATENDIVRLLSEMTLGSSFLSAQKSPASIWRNIFSRPKRNCIFANKYFFFHTCHFFFEQLPIIAQARKHESEKTHKIIWLYLFSYEMFFGHLFCLFGCTTAASQQQMGLNFELFVSNQLFSVVLAYCKWFKIRALVLGCDICDS